MKKIENDCKTFGMARVAAASPKLSVANPAVNIREMKDLLYRASEAGVQLLAFPELCITGYTCQDLFFQKTLQTEAMDALLQLAEETRALSIVYVAGLPLVVKNRLFNCAAVVYKGEILGVVPKSYLPNTKEFYEKRWFSVRGEPFAEAVAIGGREVPFGKVLFDIRAAGILLGIEICEDLWAPLPPSTAMSLEGANVIVNLSASNELVAKGAYRKALVEQQSARCFCAYIYAGAGVFESTTDLVFAGDCMIAESGVILARSKRFSRENQLIIADIDTEKILFERQGSSSFSDDCALRAASAEYAVAAVPAVFAPRDLSASFYRAVDPFPFVPSAPLLREERCEEIFQIQTAGLAKRVEHAGVKTVYVGISGGLDSTLALLIAHKTFELLRLPVSSIVGVTMPGFGTTNQTYDNAVALMKHLRVTINEIDIRESCMTHFRDIRHDPQVLDVTYENVQARERTQILMDLANKHGGIVVGTGDLSELALGWCTYNGDHMSMYGVNASIPKTLIRYLIEWISQTQESAAVREVLLRILDTPISPELLPPDKDGHIAQKTECTIGPYELHDFFLYCLLRLGAGPEKTLFLAEKAFDGKYDRGTIRNWLNVFYKRFFAQQFKRSCMPDGPKVGSVSLSPRGDWRMPSDADGSAWFMPPEPDDGASR